MRVSGPGRGAGADLQNSFSCSVVGEDVPYDMCAESEADLSDVQCPDTQLTLYSSSPRPQLSLPWLEPYLER